jgi:hypothetical protein
MVNMMSLCMDHITVSVSLGTTEHCLLYCTQGYLHIPGYNRLFASWIGQHKQSLVSRSIGKIGLPGAREAVARFVRTCIGQSCIGQSRVIVYL